MLTPAQLRNAIPSLWENKIRGRLENDLILIGSYNKEHQKRFQLDDISFFSVLLNEKYISHFRSQIVTGKSAILMDFMNKNSQIYHKNILY